MWRAAVHCSTDCKQSVRLTAPRAQPMQESSMTNRISTPRAASYVMLALVTALLIVACGGNGDSATSSQSSPTSQAASDRPVTASMHIVDAHDKNPCELAIPEMVVFGQE